MTTLITNSNNIGALKLVIAADIANTPLKIVTDESGGLPRLLVHPDTEIFIPNAGVWHLLKPAFEVTQKVNEWLEWECSLLSPNLAALLGSNSKNDNLQTSLTGYLKRLNENLRGDNLADGKIRACDVAIWTTLYPMYLDEALSKKYLSGNSNILTWMKKLEDSFKDSLAKYKVAAGSASYQVLAQSAHYFSGNMRIKTLESSPQHQLSVEVVTSEELENAEKAFQKDTKDNPLIKVRSKPILPKTDEKNILITSALPYVNNVPHLGNIIGCVLSADVFARYCRLVNYNTLFICGTDEYGTATETKALEEGLSCRTICDKYYALHKGVYDWFDCSFDYFGRTSDPEQTELCQQMFFELNNNGFMFTQSVEQLHCGNCDRYLADRFVEGGCPHPGCGYDDARGDQCDKCGKLVNAVELINPRCKICSQAPKLKTSEQFFLDLPKVEPLLLHWVKQRAPGWSNNAQVIARTWLKEGLKPRCITRDLKWGVPVPLDGYRNKVFYVWFDAPIGYMSMTKAYTEDWQKWWQPDRNVDVKLYQFMAKDNVPFHTVMFPACLLGCNKGYITVSHLLATEYLNYEDGKFSKSRGVGVFGDNARDTGIPSDVWRFYLLYIRPETQDSSFCWADLATKNNSELLNNLGNFVNRALVFAKNNFNKTVPEMKLNRDDLTLLALCTRELKSYIGCLEKGRLRDGIRHILSISRHGNQYMQSNQPWVLCKGSDDDKLRGATVIGVSCNLACLLALLLYPYMPQTSDNLRKQLNCPSFALNPENPQISILLPPGHKLNDPSPLFTKLEQSKIEELKQKFAGQQNGNGGDVQKNLDVGVLEKKVAEQADKVRSLKSSGIEKAVWQPEVAVLLKFKADLENAKKNSAVKEEEAKPVQNGIASPEEVQQLEAEINQQGSLVRKLKEGGAEKSQVQPEISKLLTLKSKLAALIGVPIETKKSKKSKK